MTAGRADRRQAGELIGKAVGDAPVMGNREPLLRPGPDEVGPVPAVAKLLARTGYTLDDFDLIEVNEAFAVQVLAVLAGWGTKLDDVEDRLNVNGSGISLGHPIGATGVRIMTTMLHELQRRGGGLALETMCIGGGQGLAAVFSGVPA